MLKVFGVDGRYGRHYTFLKAIAALWHVLIDSRVRATFKIDLDQVFPQAELLAQTGRSAFAHLATPLWGATGRDSNGNPIDLGMIAGGLVNQQDFEQGLFTPDVRMPSGRVAADEMVFFSRLPQALSTEAEMMTRYEVDGTPDGRDACLERIHVTGGTNGILIESLRRFRPFTPSFIGRAEDQAYILSTLDGGTRLGYVHASGLIMRHDKEGFAQEAIAKAKSGETVGDVLRILLFSAYAEALPANTDQLKGITDPYSGCFISRIPVTVALLRFALTTAALFRDGRPKDATNLMGTGIPQLRETLIFTQGRPSTLQQVYDHERQGWELFYEALEGIEQALLAKEDWALDIRQAAQRIVANGQVN